MRRLFRLCGAMTPWLSLGVPLFWLSILIGLGYLAPHLFCMEMNLGGKEFICGARYSHIGIQVIQRVGLFAWVLLLLAGGAQLFLLRTSRPAVLAWSVSALLLVSFAALWLAAPVSNCP
jgi:hypothetical protein